jgi:2-C-methyl-D-erythritol 4-phosphate cytidylyltransferase
MLAVTDASSQPAPALPEGAEVWAIVVGAGAGERMAADRPKAFVRFRGRTLLASSLKVFDDHPGIDGVVCVVPAGYEERATLVIDDLLADKVAAAVAGGSTRVESVVEGLHALPESASFVLVHDAARPLVSDEVVERVLAPLSEGWDGAVPGLPVDDTLKRVGSDGGVEETVSRDGLWAVQTPQAFAADRFRHALASHSLLQATDCAGVVEAAGGRVKVVEGDPRLLKVTSEADLETVAGWR